MDDLTRMAFRNPTDAVANMLVHLGDSTRYQGQPLGRMVRLVTNAVQWNTFVCVGATDRLHGIGCWALGSKASQLESFRSGTFAFDAQTVEDSDTAFLTLISATDRRALLRVMTELKHACTGKEMIWNRRKDGALGSIVPKTKQYTRTL